MTLEAIYYIGQTIAVFAILASLVIVILGGLAEDAVSGSQLGELFQAIIVRQFTDLRDGDRFWYQNDLNSQELDRVRNTTLAQIIRDNTGINSEIQDNVFEMP